MHLYVVMAEWLFFCGECREGVKGPESVSENAESAMGVDRRGGVNDGFSEKFSELSCLSEMLRKNSMFWFSRIAKDGTFMIGGSSVGSMILLAILYYLFVCKYVLATG